jgi:hypothetical protein
LLSFVCPTCTGIQALGPDGSVESPTPIISPTSYEPIIASSEDELHCVPWTIRNKYYTANVHFALVDRKGWRVRHAIGVPAVVFVWARGEVRMTGL